MFGWWRRRKRRKLEEQPVPDEWERYLERGFPAWRGLGEDDRRRFLDLLKVFVWTKGFVGAGGLEVTDEMKVLVGACAVRLVMGLDVDRYNHLTEIVLYPHEELVDPRTGEQLLGAAHTHGAIVLSWPAVKRGLRDPDDGRDTALHEFAHSLDLESGSMDGAPVLRAHDSYRPWAQALGRHYEAIQDGSDVLRAYGGTAPAEMFAVATEEFFERPERLRKRAPDLFAVLERFYGYSSRV